MAKLFDFGVYDRKHLANIARRLKAIGTAFDKAVKKGCALGESTGFNDPEGEFSFKDYPQIKKRLDDLLKDLRSELGVTIKEGDREEWLLSCAKNDALVETINHTANFPKKTLNGFKNQNMAALAAFQGRKVSGLGLSQRVWNLSDQFKGELELALELGLGEGKSADELSRDVRKYLREPNRLFRRVRDEKGALRLSKAAKACHPGRGVYRSSYKNALRLTATENNMAYRTADHLRWQQLDFVLGIEVGLSNNHPCEDVCDELSGVYPKTFKFVGWHPFCRCFAVPRLAKPDEVADYSRRLADGEDMSSFEYPGQVVTLPDKFTTWVKDNQERIDTAKSMPYFLRDNEGLLNPKPTPAEIAAQRHAKRTQAQIDKIKHDYWMRFEPDYLTESQKEANIAVYLQIERELGVKRGRPMTFEEADQMKGNPHYFESEAYRINCQTCVVAYEMRLRGFDVSALPNTKGSKLYELSKAPSSAWLSKAGKAVEEQHLTAYTIEEETYMGVSVRRKVGEPQLERLLENLDKRTKNPGRYDIGFGWDDPDATGGHTISLERGKDGSLSFYDPQIGSKISNFGKYCRRNKVRIAGGIRLWRIDDATPDWRVLGGVLTKGEDKFRSGIMGELAGLGKSNSISWFERYNAATTNSERVALMREHIASADFRRLDYHSSKTGAIFGVNMGEFDKALSQKEMPKNLALARKLTQHGYDVYLLPNPHGITSADFILRKNGKLIYAEGKRMDGKNSLDHLLAKGATQSDCVVADIVGRMDFNYIFGNIKNIFERSDIRELILLKGSRPIIITKQLSLSNDFAKTFKRIWTSKK